jgi:hypothetical protein
MTFTINDVRACSGGGHVEIDYTVSGGTLRTFRTTRPEILAELNAEDREELEKRALLRCISRVKEATTGTPTPVQVRNALVGQTFEI